MDGKLEVRPEFEGIFKIIETAEGPYRNEIAEPDELYMNLGNGRFEKADPAVTFFDEEGQPAGLSGDRSEERRVGKGGSSRSVAVHRVYSERSSRNCVWS